MTFNSPEHAAVWDIINRKQGIRLDIGCGSAKMEGFVGLEDKWKILDVDREVLESEEIFD